MVGIHFPEQRHVVSAVRLDLRAAAGKPATGLKIEGGRDLSFDSHMPAEPFLSRMRFRIGCHQHGQSAVVWGDSFPLVALEPAVARNAPRT